MTRSERPGVVVNEDCEQELAVIPGERPGTAIRVRVDSTREGFARLEQLAFQKDLGWYTQKSFCIPREMVRAVAGELQKADCLLPHEADQASAGRMAVQPDLPASAPLRLAERRNA